MAKKTNCIINGKEYYRIKRKIGEDANGKSIFKQFYGSCKKEAEAEYEAYKEKQRRAPNKDADASLGRLAKMFTYQVLINKDLAPSTVELYERQYRTKLAPSVLATRPIFKISSMDIQMFFNELSEQHLDGRSIKVSQGALKALYKYMSQLFKYLKAEGYCDNLLETVTVPEIKTDAPTKKKDSGIEVFTEDEIKRILSVPNRKLFLYELAFATGLRQGELLALTYSDIVEGNVRVSKQFNQHAQIFSDGTWIRKQVIKDPKTAGSDRTVPMPDSLKAALRRHTAWHKQEMLRNNYRTDYLFTTETGQLIDRGDFRRAWQRHLKRAGVPYKKFHACRATYCTQLCKNGVPIEIASSLMGHESVETTAAYYRSVSMEELKAAATNINHLFEAID